MIAARGELRARLCAGGGSMVQESRETELHAGFSSRNAICNSYGV